MRITHNDLFIPLGPEEADIKKNILDAWCWLIPVSAKPFLASSLGDVFLQDFDGVYWLNVGNGSYTKIAKSVAEFQSLLDSPENMEAWFIPQLVGDILSTGINRKPNECFGFKIPPVLGGEYEPGNFYSIDLSAYCSVLGDIIKEVRNVPD